MNVREISSDTTSAEKLFDGWCCFWKWQQVKDAVAELTTTRTRKEEAVLAEAEAEAKAEVTKEEAVVAEVVWWHVDRDWSHKWPQRRWLTVTAISIRNFI